MTLEKAAHTLDHIAQAGVKSPFTFWVLLAVTALGLIMASGSFWMLSRNMEQMQAQSNATNERYNRLFTVMEAASARDLAREAKMITELRETRKEYSSNLKTIVDMLVKQAPTKMDEERGRDALRVIDENKRSLKILEERQSRIIDSLESIKASINGKTGR